MAFSHKLKRFKSSIPDQHAPRKLYHQIGIDQWMPVGSHAVFFFNSFNYYYYYFFIVHLLLLKELQITCYALFLDWNYGRHLLLWLCTQTMNKTWERTPASPSLYQPELLQYCHLLPWLTQVHQAQLSYWSSNAARCDLFCTTRIHASALASATTTDPSSAVLCLVIQGTRSCLNFMFKRWKYFDKLLSQRSKIRRALR